MKDALKKARQQVDDARRILESVEQEDGYYTDRKSIKRAGRIAYNGIMIGLNRFLGLTSKNEQAVSWYERKLAEIDSTQSCHFHSAYCLLYLSMGSDGSLLPLISSEALKEADEFISWIEANTAAAEAKSIII